MAEKMNTICPTCTESATLGCKGCDGVKYCSKECQETDAPAHKLLCETLKEFKSRPSKDMRRTIYFPADGTKPEFRWLPIDTEYDEDGNLEYEDVEKPSDMDVNMIQTFDEILITGVSFGSEYYITIWYDDSFIGDYTSTNKAVEKATDGMMGHPWAGPFLAIRGKPRDGSTIVEVWDMDMTAYSHLVAFFTGYLNRNKAYAATRGPR